MCVYLRTKFQVPKIILTSFRQEDDDDDNDDDDDDDDDDGDELFLWYG